MSAPIAFASRLGAASFVLLVSGPLLAQLGVVEPSAGYSLSSMSGIASALGSGIGLVALAKRDRPARRRGWIGVVLAFVTSLTTIVYGQIGQRAEHWEATTSTEDPVAFAAHEVGALGPADLVAPRRIDAPPDAAFARVRTAAEELGWSIVHEADRHFEAEVTRGVFLFRHDVAVQVRVTTSSVTEIHARSRSRWAHPDRGANAALLEALFEAVD